MALATVVVACDGHRKPTNTTSDTAGPITDAGPYWCSVVSKTAVQRLTGVAAARMSQDGNVGMSPLPEGRCRVSSTDGKIYVPLELEVNSQSTALYQYGQATQAAPTNTLPARDGRGGIVLGKDDNQIYSLYRCGKYTLWLRLFVGPIAHRSEPAADLTTLLELAQRRLASTVVHCTLNASAPVATSTAR